MNYLHYKIAGTTGDLIKVKTDGSAFVRLLDPLNFEYYKIGRKFDGQGGWNDQPYSEYLLPYKGTFHLVIDLGGNDGIVKATVDIARKS